MSVRQPRVRGDPSPGDEGTTVEEASPPTPAWGSTAPMMLLIGLAIAIIGFVFSIIYLLIDILGGSYFGADPEIGMSVSGGVLVIGLTIVTLVIAVNWAENGFRRAVTYARNR